MGHRLSRSRQRPRPHRHESLENLRAHREFHNRLRSEWKRLHAAHGVGKHPRVSRHQVVSGTAISGCLDAHERRLQCFLRRESGGQTAALHKKPIRSWVLLVFGHTRCKRAVPRSTSTTAPITIAPAIATFSVTDSFARKHPNNTPPMGFTYVCVATSVGE